MAAVDYIRFLYEAVPLWTVGATVKYGNTKTSRDVNRSTGANKRNGKEKSAHLK